MPTPSIQTLRTDAQQVPNLDSISAVRSVVAATLANANAGTPLNPNLTTQQLWNEFYQIVTQPKSDIESIIANQLMKFLYAPPAPGGAGANGQVIFNDGGVLAGDPQFLWNKTTNLLTVTGSATITGNLTVDTNTLFVDAANNRVGIGTASPGAGYALDVVGAARITAANGLVIDKAGSGFVDFFNSGNAGANVGTSGTGGLVIYTANGIGGAYSVRHTIAGDGVATWSNVGGVAGTAMTLDASGRLLVGKTTTGLTVGFEAHNNGYVTSNLAASTDGSATLGVYSTGASASRFYVGMGGTVFATNTTISAISDARLKENVQDIDVGLGAILALKPRKFDWKEGKGKNIKGDRGFIAQEFETVFPNLIDEWKDVAPEGEAPYKSVRQDLIPVLVKAIQELTARVEALEA